MGAERGGPSRESGSERPAQELLRVPCYAGHAHETWGQRVGAASQFGRGVSAWKRVLNFGAWLAAPQDVPVQEKNHLGFP